MLNLLLVVFGYRLFVFRFVLFFFRGCGKQPFSFSRILIFGTINFVIWVYESSVNIYVNFGMGIQGFRFIRKNFCVAVCRIHKDFWTGAEWACFPPGKESIWDFFLPTEFCISPGPGEQIGMCNLKKVPPRSFRRSSFCFWWLSRRCNTRPTCATVFDDFSHRLFYIVQHLRPKRHSIAAVNVKWNREGGNRS